MMGRIQTNPRSSRGAVFIEFAIMLPFFALLITTILDIGIMTLTRSAVQEAAYSAARASAQYGGASLQVANGGLSSACQDPSTPCNDLNLVGYNAFVENIKNPVLSGSVSRVVPRGYAPGDELSGFDFYVVDGSVCEASPAATSQFVEVRVNYTIYAITPFIAEGFRLASNSPENFDGYDWAEGGIPQSVSAVARCEVVRSL